jgi:hypothetical protein
MKVSKAKISQPGANVLDFRNSVRKNNNSMYILFTYLGLFMPEHSDNIAFYQEQMPRVTSPHNHDICTYVCMYVGR